MAKEQTQSLAPLGGFALFFLLEALLFPPKPPAADAGPIETWITFGLAQLVMFSIVFAVLLGLFWAAARVSTKQPSPVSQHFTGAAILSTCLLLTLVAGRWYVRR